MISCDQQKRSLWQQIAALSAFVIELPKMVITKDLSNRVVGDMSLATGSVPSLNKIYHLHFMVTG